MPNQPLWTNTLGITCTKENKVKKLLGVPFDTSLSSLDFDSFLQQKINKKLEHQNL